jgi:hypothetical protein
MWEPTTVVISSTSFNIFTITCRIFLTWGPKKQTSVPYGHPCPSRINSTTIAYVEIDLWIINLKLEDAYGHTYYQGNNENSLKYY